MALTSTDQAQSWMGMKNWARLHFVGGHWIWMLFLLTYANHVKQGHLWFYLPYLVFYVGADSYSMCKTPHPPTAPNGALI